jgi:hypothetical protein
MPAIRKPNAMFANKKIFALATVTVIGSLLLTGCSQKPDGNHTSKPTASSSASSSPSSESTPKPTKLDVPRNDQTTESDELKSAQAAFPDAKATKNFSKDEVQLALNTASQYIGTASVNGYYISGNFEKDKYPTKRLENDFKRYFLYTAWDTFEQSLNDKDSTVKLPDGTTAPQWINTMQAMVWFTQLNGGEQKDWLPANCYEQSQAEACMEGNPYRSGVTYAEAADGKSIVVTQDVSYKQIFINEGQKGTQKITQHFILSLVKNDPKAAAIDEGVPTMVIQDFNNHSEWDDWKADS